MSIEIPRVQPGELITAGYLNSLAKTLEGLDIRIAKLESAPVTPLPDTGKRIEITAITPVAPREGDDVTITGKNFGASRGISSVAFDGVGPQLYRSWTDTEIVCIVPVLHAPVGGKVVTVVVTNLDTSDA